MSKTIFARTFAFLVTAGLLASSAMGQEQAPQINETALEQELPPIEWSEVDGGLGEGAAHDESLPKVYVLPMRGQMGTDIHPDAYVRVLEELKREKPDLLVWVMRSADIGEEFMFVGQDIRDTISLPFFDDYRRLVSMFRDDLADVRQVVWVEDAVGMSALIAMAWETVYMTPTARLGGLQRVYEMGAGWQDQDVKAKMIAAITGIAKGFLNRSGRPIILGDAMMNPAMKLSASWRGREVIWHLNTEGEYVVNSSDKTTPTFRAKLAEDLGIVAGIAETLDDLLLLEGIREYRLVRGPAEQHIRRYVEDWRRQYENTRKWWRDYQQHMSWAQGGDTLRYIGRARNDIRNIINAMNRFPAIETRWGSGSKFQLETLDEQLAEQIRALRSGGGGGGGGRGIAPGR